MRTFGKFKLAFGLFLTMTSSVTFARDLFDAVRVNNYEKAESLLQSGAKPDQYAIGGLSSLFMASDRKMAQLLIDNGAFLNGCNDDGESVLMWAIRGENADLVKFYLPIVEDKEDYKKNTALSLALEKNWKEIATLLIKQFRHNSDYLKPRETELLSKFPELAAEIPMGPKALEKSIPLAKNSEWEFDEIQGGKVFRNMARQKMKQIRINFDAKALNLYSSYEPYNALEISFELQSKEYLSDLESSPLYEKFKEKIWSVAAFDGYVKYHFKKSAESTNALELIEALDEFEKIEPPAVSSKMKTEIERITRLLQ